MADIKPFHESIIDVLDPLSKNSHFVTVPRLRLIADLLRTTKIPANHEAIIAAWEAIDGHDTYPGVVDAIRQQMLVDA